MDIPNSTCAECESRGETPSSALLSHDVDVHGYCSEPGCRLYLGTFDLLQQHRQAAANHFFCPGPAGPSCNINHSYQTAIHLQAHRSSSAHVIPLERCAWNCCKDRRFISVAALAAHYDANACPPMPRLALNRHVYSIDTKHGPGQQPRPFVVDDDQLPADERHVIERIAASLEWAERTGRYACLQNYCYLTFTSYRKLILHMKSSVHDPYLYRCGTCLRSFKVLSGLAGHVAGGACGVDSAAVGLQIKELMRLACLGRRRELHNPII